MQELPRRTYNGSTMLGDSKQKTATIELNDPNAVKPIRKQGTLKMLFNQLKASGSPALVGEEVLPPKLVGNGNFHWQPLAWTRWVVHWEMFKTLVLVGLLLGLGMTYMAARSKNRYEVALPQPATELLLKARSFDTFNRNQAEAFILFAINAANESSSEGMPNLPLLEGTMDPAIYLKLQQKTLTKGNQLQLTEFPIYTIYISEATRWRYNPGKRVISVYVKGFRMMHTLSGKSNMEPYRADIDMLWEPMSNRNKWGYYFLKFSEYMGEAAEISDREIADRDQTVR